MLSLDVFKGQLNNKVLAEFKRINCTCSFNVAINKPLKDRIHYDAHEEQWIENKYSVGDRRVMLVSQVAQAWDDLHCYDSESIRQAFRDVGLALPTDGSRDDEIKIKVGNWTPTKGVSNKEDIIQTSNQLSIDTIMSNRTLKEVEDQAVGDEYV